MAHAILGAAPRTPARISQLGPRGLVLPALVSAVLAFTMAGCAGGVASTPAAPTKRGGGVPPTRQPTRTLPRDPQFQAVPGLEGVIGADRGRLEREFGQPRLDVWEGDARKLQFVGTACVLDIYLYPTTSSREPLATYVDARRASDGKDVDRAACVTALKK